MPTELPPNSASFLRVHASFPSLDEIFRDDRNSDLKRKTSTRKDEQAEKITGKMEHEINTGPAS